MIEFLRRVRRNSWLGQFWEFVFLLVALFIGYCYLVIT